MREKEERAKEKDREKEGAVVQAILREIDDEEKQGSKKDVGRLKNLKANLQEQRKQDKEETDKHQRYVVR